VDPDVAPDDVVPAIVDAPTPAAAAWPALVGAELDVPADKGAVVPWSLASALLGWDGPGAME